MHRFAPLRHRSLTFFQQAGMCSAASPTPSLSPTRDSDSDWLLGLGAVTPSLILLTLDSTVYRLSTITNFILIHNLIISWLFTFQLCLLVIRITVCMPTSANVLLNNWLAGCLTDYQLQTSHSQFSMSFIQFPTRKMNCRSSLKN